MKRTTLLRNSGLALAAVTLSTGLAACGGDDAATDSSSNSGDSSQTEETPMDEESSSDAAGGEMDPTADLYGPACKDVPTSGKGSVDGMATAPVASAAAANPLVSTTVQAVTAADLVEPLNSAPELTVFAPANDAYKAFSKADLTALLKDKKTLTAVLTHHVVPMKIAPDELGGTYETLNGDKLVINGEGEQATIDDEKANVLCGGIQTANATVYVIDTVMMP